jgi:hypothetical protein
VYPRGGATQDPELALEESLNLMKLGLQTVP